MVGWWRFDDVNSTGDPTDLSSYSNNGSLQGDALINSTGYFGNASHFDGTGDFVVIDSVVDDLSGSTTGTWSAWVNSREEAPSNLRVISFGDTDASERIELIIDTSQRLLLVVRDEGVQQSVLRTDNGVFPNNTWVHVAIVQNGTFPVAYIDGVEVSQSFVTSTDLSSWFFETTGIDNGRIASLNQDSSGEASFFNGAVDDFLLFNRSLSSQEIQSLYNASANQYFHNFTSLSDSDYAVKGYSVNTTGFKNETESRTITVGTDTTSPTYSDAQANQSISNQDTEFALRVDDDFSLETNGYYIFSTNNSGTWVNDSLVNFTSTPEWANVTKTLNETFGQVVGYRWYLYDNLGNFNYTEEFALTTVAGTISVLYPSENLVFQRDNSTTGEIKIFGSYNGNVSSFEASFNDSGWVTINSSSSNGVFTGNFNGSVGSGNLSVRFSNDVSVSENISIGIGDVFVVGGQSNAEGRGNTNNSFNTSLGFATMYRLDDSWGILDDPTSSRDTSQFGSPWPLVANYLVTNQSIPLGFITAAIGGTEIGTWVSGGENYNNMRDQITEATNGSMKVKTLLFFQGERDMNTGLGAKGNYDTYKNSLGNVADDFISDTEIAETIIVGQVNNQPNSANRSSIDNIRKAQQDSWDETNNISGYVTSYDVNFTVDDVHFQTDNEMSTFVDRWEASIMDVIYGIGDSRGPRINNITFDEGDNDTLILNFTEDSLPLKIGFYNGTTSSVAKGFSFYLGNGTFANNTFISSTEVINQNQLRINLTINITSDLNVSLGSFRDAYGEPIVRDSSGFSLPTETFYNQTVYMVPDSTAPTLSILYPTSTTYSTNITTLNFTASDETALSKCWYSTDNGVTNSTLNDCTANFSNINATSSGSNTWFVYANDSSDNVNATSVSFTYSAPTSSSSSSSSSSSGSSGTITHSPSSEDVKDGYNRRFQEREKVDISGSDEGKVQVEIIEIVKGDSRVDFGFGGEVYSARTNESVKIDTNNDGFYDLEISVNEVINSVYADLTFREIYEEISSEKEEEKVEEVVDENEGEEKYGFWKLVKMFFVDAWDWVKGIF